MLPCSGNSTGLSVPYSRADKTTPGRGSAARPGSAGQRGHDTQKEELRLNAPLTRVKMRPTGFAVAARSWTLLLLGSSFPTSHAIFPHP